MTRRQMTTPTPTAMPPECDTAVCSATSTNVDVITSWVVDSLVDIDVTEYDVSPGDGGFDDVTARDFGVVATCDVMTTTDADVIEVTTRSGASVVDVPLDLDPGVCRETVVTCDSRDVMTLDDDVDADVTEVTTRSEALVADMI